MKILSLRFKNLNSLRGEWAIDFTDPAYAEEGIFAITGPTGAGKTTILDALCLALYGKTPRLARISKSGNEVMTRGTGDCLAEVVFTSQKGRYCCQWSQQRARKKPDGEWQQPRHEISDLDSGIVLSTKKNDVQDLIREKTGMSFEQFTRSTLLAQGAFAAFLQADQDERSPILEQITGTEIYSIISIKVHERKTAEQSVLDRMMDEIGHIPILSPEEEAALNQKKEEKRRQAEELERERKTLQEAEAWVEAIQAGERILADLENEERSLKEKRERSAPEMERLARARAATACEAEYTGLITIRQTEQQEREESERRKAELAGLKTEAEQAARTAADAERDLKKAKAHQEEELPIIRKARDLDTRITEAKKQLESFLTKEREKQKRVAEEQRAIEAAKQKWKETEQTGEEKKQYLSIHAADAPLQEELSGMITRMESYLQLEEERTEKAENLKKAERGIQEAEEQVIRDKTGQDAETKAQTELETALQRLREERKQNLDGREIPSWRDQEQQLRERTENLRVATETLAKEKDFRQKNHAIEADDFRIKVRLRELNTESALAEQEAILKTTIIREKEKNRLLQAKIQKYENDRAELVDGSPCPLCGSINHPYAAGNAPKELDGDEDLIREQEDLQKAQQRIITARASIASLTTEQERNERERTGIDQQIQEAIKVWEIRTGEIGLTDKSEEKLKIVREQVKDELERTSRIIRTAEELNSVITKAEQAVQKGKEKIIEWNHTVDKNDQKLSGLRKDKARISTERDELDEKIRTTCSLLLGSLQPFGYTALSPECLPKIRTDLTGRRDRYSTAQKVLQKCERVCSSLIAEITTRCETVAANQEELKGITEQGKAIREEYEDLVKERSSLYGEKDPEKEEARCTQAVKDAERCDKEARNRMITLSGKVQSLLDQITAGEVRLMQYRSELTDMNRNFLAEISMKGFLGEEAWNQARIAIEEREQLEKREEEMKQEENRLNSLLAAKKNELAAEKEKQITDLESGLLRQKREETEERVRECREELGSLQAELNEHHRNQERIQGNLAAIEAQKTECSRWNLLHELIGSNDGKKFRIFAQGLTFRTLISHANRHLRRMSDRYILVQDTSQPLDLNVIDTYQAGEVRTTKNLSGGEGFLVSLALALGLSGMAGKNVRVDSLFLDEGFGTLDDDALETALDTLTSLEEEGKLIGIISHVPALRERIATKIQVERKSGGISTLSGPGCSRSG